MGWEVGAGLTDPTCVGLASPLTQDGLPEPGSIKRGAWRGGPWDMGLSCFFTLPFSSRARPECSSMLANKRSPKFLSVLCRFTKNSSAALTELFGLLLGQYFMGSSDQGSQEPGSSCV